MLLLLFSRPVMSSSVTSWSHDASLSLTISQSLPKFIFTASVMPSSHLVLWYPLLLLPLIFPSIRDFSSESCVHIRWPTHLNYSFCISPSSEYLELISLRSTGLTSLLSKGLSGVFSSTAIQRHEFFGVLPSLLSSSHNHTWPLGRLQPWLYRPLSAEQCLCFSTHCLGLSLLSCHEATIFWFQGCSHHLQWFWSPRK